MTADQLTVFVVLLAAMGMFLWGRWRHDMVALGALLACVFLGLVPGAGAFAGFGHPAVTTVAAVLVLGRGLQLTGVADAVAKRVLPAKAGPTGSLLALTALAALLSGFMNNVGALALLMPVAIQMAGKHGLPPGKFLMPLAFGSILGGMMTLIGSPPNLIVSGYRASAGLGAFAMFDFTPVGVTLALCGVAFVGLVGWRLVPARKQAQGGSFESGAYLSEVRLVERGKAVGKRLREVEQMLDEVDAQIVSLIRNEVRVQAPHPGRVLRAGDILVIEIEPDSLSSALSTLGMKLEADVPPEAGEEEGDEKGRDAAAQKGNAAKEEDEEEGAGRTEVVIRELVVMPSSGLERRSATDVRLRTLYGINLLAISRKGQRSIRRLRSTRLRAGDVLLVQGDEEALSGFAASFGCLPLAPRDIRVPRRGKALLAALVMALAVGAAAAGWWPASVTFAAGALLYVVLGVVPLRNVYEAIDWPVIILLAAMLPVAGAMEATGAADLAARLLLDHVAAGGVAAGLTAMLVLTILLSSLMNNAATAAVMCPVALGVARQLEVNPDGFLMAVAVGASCAFLTPIGHQSNTLILGPGGFRFGDYWRLGLALEIIVVAVGVPALLWVFPPG